MEGLEEEAEILHADLNALQDEVEKSLRNMQDTPSTSIRAIEDASKKINGKIGKARVLLRELEALSEEAGDDEVFKSLVKKVSDQKRRLEGSRDVAKQTFSDAGRRLRAHVAKTEREELLGRSPVKSSSSSAAAAGRGGGDNNELQAAEKITSSLQKTRQLLARQLDHTESTLGIMDESQATLTKVNETYGEHSGLLKTGKRLLTSLENQEKLERFLLYLFFGIFLLVVAYIVSKRFLFFAPVHKLLLHKYNKSKMQEETRSGVQHHAVPLQAEISGAVEMLREEEIPPMKATFSEAVEDKVKDKDGDSRERPKPPVTSEQVEVKSPATLMHEEALPLPVVEEREQEEQELVQEGGEKTEL